MRVIQEITTIKGDKWGLGIVVGVGIVLKKEGTCRRMETARIDFIRTIIMCDPKAVDYATMMKDHVDKLAKHAGYQSVEVYPLINKEEADTIGKVVMYQVFAGGKLVADIFPEFVGQIAYVDLLDEEANQIAEKYKNVR